MKFSVLIAAYRADPYIWTALESVRTQTYEDWELIVVEDGSRGETEAIVRAFAAATGKAVRYENLEQNQGVAVARNRLLELAKGDAVAFLDADDRWMPRHLASAAETLSTGADVAISRVQLFELPSQRLLETYTPAPEFFGDPVAQLFARSWVMTSSCVSLKRSIIARAGRFDPAFRIGEDRDYWLRCALAGARFADTNEVTCHYAKHAASTMGKTLLWAQQESAFYEKHRDLPAITPARRRQERAHALANYARLLRRENPRESAQLLWKAWRLDPLQLGHASQFVCSAMKASFAPAAAA